MNKKINLLIIIIISIIVSSTVYAAVGVGVSPSKMRFQVEGGKTQRMELLLYNTGDYDLELGVKLEGDIAEIATATPEKVTVKPEPKPHEMPIKNGKKVTITFTPPATRRTKTYTGKIAASGTPKGVQLGGSVGVASLVEMIVTPTPSILAFITPIHILVAGIIIGLIIIILILWKLGLKIEFKRK